MVSKHVEREQNMNDKALQGTRQMNAHAPAKPAFRIEKDVPLPTHGGSGAPSKYPFAQMDIGDSFVGHGEKVKAAAWAYAKRNGAKFISRTVAPGQFRIWRVS
jgi:hypothetical protein